MNDAMPGYAEKPAEAAQNPRVKGWLDRVCSGDVHAFQWCWTLWTFTQLLDDLVDGDKPVALEEAAKAFAALLVQVSINPFHREHAHQLVPLMVSACSRWVQGDRLAQDPQTRSLARAVRCGDVDLFLQVAFITGGWDHMQQCAAEAGYDEE